MEKDVYDGRGPHRPIGTVKRAVDSLLILLIFRHLVDISLLYVDTATKLNELKQQTMTHGARELCIDVMDRVNSCRTDVKNTGRSSIGALKKRMRGNGNSEEMGARKTPYPAER